MQHSQWVWLRPSSPILIIWWSNGGSMSLKFFLGKVVYIPLGVPCDHIMAINDSSNATMPLLLLLFQFYELVSLITATMLQTCQALELHPWTNCLCVMSLQVIRLYQWIFLYMHVFLCLLYLIYACIYYKILVYMVTLSYLFSFCLLSY